MAKRPSKSASPARPPKIEYAGVVALSAILVISLAGVWQRSGIEAVVAQVSCSVQAAVPGGQGPCDTGHGAGGHPTGER